MRTCSYYAITTDDNHCGVIGRDVQFRAALRTENAILRYASVTTAMRLRFDVERQSISRRIEDIIVRVTTEFSAAMLKTTRAV